MKYDSYARKGEQVSVGNFLRKDHRNSALHNLGFFFFRPVDLADSRLAKQDVFESYIYSFFIDYICIATKTFSVVWI